VSEHAYQQTSGADVLIHLHTRPVIRIVFVQYYNLTFQFFLETTY